MSVVSDLAAIFSAAQRNGVATPAGGRVANRSSAAIRQALGNDAATPVRVL